MIRLSAFCWWLVVAALLPLLLPQAYATRRKALRLAVPEGPHAGTRGAVFGQVPLRLLVVGESTVAGIGVDRTEQALPCRLAACLADRLQSPVHWQAWGEKGLDARSACRKWLADDGQDWDIVVLVFGVNDTTGLSGLWRWQRAMGQLIGHFRRNAACVLCTGVPPIQHFTVLPVLLRRLLGWRAALLDRRLRDVCGRRGAVHCPMPSLMQPAYLACDGYHPSASGYRAWAQSIIEQASGHVPVKWPQSSGASFV